MGHDMHEAEPKLVFKGSTGQPIPTKEFDALFAEATKLGGKHVAALVLQVDRQVGQL